MEIIIIPVLMKTTVAILLLAILFLSLYILKAKKSTTTKEKHSETVISKAIVLSVEKTGFLINNQPQILMQLQVFPAKGRNFVTEVKEILPSAHVETVRAGSIIKVKYNSANTKEISLIEAV